ncbi:hypothetical protein E3N88_12147 [Mikania micrantha]|uniref:Protein kinase domain-containing protein n=1 Tax=Mikania micrantha TaxID=192012 RepID=A0A5N6P603_9ASTR|nr:hypothetical protein E3N88_12147 [Mikania micrantha]
MVVHTKNGFVGVGGDKKTNGREHWAGKAFGQQKLSACGHIQNDTNDYYYPSEDGYVPHMDDYIHLLYENKPEDEYKITKKEHKDERRVGDFLSELGIMAHINHPNAARLIGFSSDTDLYLVLQFVAHGSLAARLHYGEEILEWALRFKVALGIAEGLRYLHYDWTLGYMAPEYFMHGIVHEKIDMFSYGVLLLELITGHPAIDSNRQSLVIWEKPLLEENNTKELIDPHLENDYEITELKSAMTIASVIQILKGEGLTTEPSRDKTNSGCKILLDACDFDDYTSTTYLKDLNRELVME